MNRLASVTVAIVMVASAAAYAARPLTSGTLLVNKRFGDWSVLAIRFDNDSISFKAGTKSLTNPGASYFFAFNNKDCSKVVMDFTDTSPQRFPADINQSNAGTGAIRVDSSAIHALTMPRIAANLGENSMHMYLRMTEPTFDPLFLDIKKGEFMRLKVSLQKKDYYYKFGLNGAAQAIAVAAVSCKKSIDGSMSPHNPDDKKYFDTNPDTQTKPSTTPPATNDKDYFF